MSIPDEKKAKFVAFKLKDGASAWWEQMQLDRICVQGFFELIMMKSYLTNFKIVVKEIDQLVFN